MTTLPGRPTWDSLATIPVTPYDELRPKLRTGDVVVCAGRYAFSRLIAWATGSPVTHAGIVIDVERCDRVLILESVESFGVRLRPLRRLIDTPYKGMVFILRPLISTDAVDLVDSAKWGFDELTTPYGWSKIAGLAARITIGFARSGKREGWICSEFAAEWLRLAGSDIPVAGRHGWITPGELWAHPSMKFVARAL